MKYIGKIIDRYKHVRSIETLEKTYKQQYALVGIGNHCLNNLLPVVQYLQLPLKYICCTSERKAALIEQKYKGVKGTTSLQEILDDESIKGIFVAAHPRAHFSIASEILKAGKALFIEKPPCLNLQELYTLKNIAQSHGAQPIVVGLQRRFSPATIMLQKRWTKESIHHYHYRYLTGLYPEGDAFTDLFIHPIDYAVFLFGKAVAQSAHSIKCKNGGMTLLLTLKHPKTMGILELSTDYSWQQAQELLNISTDKGIYSLERMEKLDFAPRTSALCGIPLEKILRGDTSIVNLYDRNGFTPTIVNNQIYTQGFFSEIKTFADMVEEKEAENPKYGLASMTETYMLMEEIRELINKK